MQSFTSLENVSKKRSHDGHLKLEDDGNVSDLLTFSIFRLPPTRKIFVFANTVRLGELEIDLVVLYINRHKGTDRRRNTLVAESLGV
jgi:hypothetical protein